jgi:uncharacterized SAM-binding protein YcdF (DUF218 family)
MTAPSSPPRRRAPFPVRLASWGVRALLLLLALWALSLTSVHLWGRRDEARAADAIVVLGAAQYDGRPSPVLKARLDHAIALYQRGLAPSMIMTGGIGPGDTVSEAMVGKRYAVHAGVPADAILTEEEGLTSLQSMRAVSRLMAGHGMKRAVLVSDPFHMLRLKLLSRRVGIEGYTSPTPSSPISRSRAQERRFLLRESVILPLVLWGG